MLDETDALRVVEVACEVRPELGHDHPRQVWVIGVPASDDPGKLVGVGGLLRRYVSSGWGSLTCDRGLPTGAGPGR